MAAHLAFWVVGETGTPLHESWRFLFLKRWNWSIVHSLRRTNNENKAKWSTPKRLATVNKNAWKVPFKTISKRPVGMEKSEPAYLQSIVNQLTKIFYKKALTGINSINSIMKDLISKSPLLSSEKRLANHSARKTLATKLNNSKSQNLKQSASLDRFRCLWWWRQGATKTSFPFYWQPSADCIHK